MSRAPRVTVACLLYLGRASPLARPVVPEATSCAFCEEEHVFLLQKGFINVERLVVSKESSPRSDESVSFTDKSKATDAFVLQAHSAGDKDYWAGKNGDQARTGASPYTVPSDLHFGTDWSYEADGNVKANPLIDENRNVYLTTDSGRVHKFNTSGYMLWSVSTEQEIHETPVLDDGKLYMCTRDGHIIALNESTGIQLWQRKVANCTAPDTSALQAANGLIILAASLQSRSCTRNNALLAVNSTTGDIRWSRRLGAQVADFLGAIDDGSLVFEDAAGQVFSLDITNGKVLWKQEAFFGVTGRGTVIGPKSTVYVTTNSGKVGKLTAYNLTTGKALWHTELELPTSTAPAVGVLHPSGKGNLSVIVGIGGAAKFSNSATARDAVVAFDADSGRRLKWKFEVPVSRPVLNGTNHEETALLSTSSNCDEAIAFSNPSIGGDGTVYIGHRSGWLYAIRDKDGDSIINSNYSRDQRENAVVQDNIPEVSTFNSRGSCHASPGIAPGMLVAASCRGLHVFTSF